MVARITAATETIQQCWNRKANPELLTGGANKKSRRRDNLATRITHSGRTATVPSDENLEAKPPAAAGGCKEERKRERLSERPVASLTRPPPPYNQNGFHRLTSTYKIGLRLRSMISRNLPHGHGYARNGKAIGFLQPRSLVVLKVDSQLSYALKSACELPSAIHHHPGITSTGGADRRPA